MTDKVEADLGVKKILLAECSQELKVLRGKLYNIK